MVWRIPEVEDRLKFLTDQVERITGLQEFGVYLNKLFTIDAIFLNEDRHMHNIAVMMNGKGELIIVPYLIMEEHCLQIQRWIIRWIRMNFC